MSEFSERKESCRHHYVCHLGLDRCSAQGCRCSAKTCPELDDNGEETSAGAEDQGRGAA